MLIVISKINKIVKIDFLFFFIYNNLVARKLLEKHMH